MVGARECDVSVASQHRGRLLIVLFTMLMLSNIRATTGSVADHSIKQFLAQSEGQHSYRALRRLEAENGDRSGWIEALTEYSTRSGFRYELTKGGGSSYIREKILGAVLDAERDAIAQGETSRSALAPSNYAFQANGVDADGLANILLSPRRKERVLVAGTMFLKPDDGELVRLQGRLAKNPSLWVKSVHIARWYDRIAGVVLPVKLDSTAELRLLGPATFRMTYQYVEIDGHSVGSRHGPTD